MISLCFMHNRKKIRPIMIGLKIHEKCFFAWDMVHNDTWYINLYKHYLLKKPKALRIPLNGALIALHSPPILKGPCSILGKFSNFGPSLLGTRDRLLLCPPPPLSVALFTSICCSWRENLKRCVHAILSQLNTAAVAFYNNNHKAKASCADAAFAVEFAACISNALLHR